MNAVSVVNPFECAELLIDQLMKTRASMLRRDRRREKCASPDTPSKPISDDFVLSDVVLSPAKLPTPWLYDSEKLLEDLDRVRECVLRIPLTVDAHGPINVALCAVWELRERLTYLIGLRAAMQDDWKTRASGNDRPAPAVTAASKPHPSRQRHGRQPLKRGVARLCLPSLLYETYPNAMESARALQGRAAITFRRFSPSPGKLARSHGQ